MTREERIQQIKDCGQTIIDKAESIYGDYDFPTSLTVTIEMSMREFPTITVKREFYSKVMLEGLRG
jgi:hypothetical protein